MLVVVGVELTLTQLELEWQYYSLLETWPTGADWKLGWWWGGGWAYWSQPEDVNIGFFWGHGCMTCGCWLRAEKSGGGRGKLTLTQPELECQYLFPLEAWMHGLWVHSPLITADSDNPFHIHQFCEINEKMIIMYEIDTNTKKASMAHWGFFIKQHLLMHLPSSLKIFPHFTWNHCYVLFFNTISPTSSSPHPGH